jgi:serine/threonine-protein phosphatase 2A regulatory subunit B'
MAANNSNVDGSNILMSNLKLAELPCIEDVPPNDRMRLFRQKLRLCCIIYDFTDPRKQVREKEAKRIALLQIVEYISAGKVAWDPAVVGELLDCVGSNIFRLLGRRASMMYASQDGKNEGNVSKSLILRS